MTFSQGDRADGLAGGLVSRDYFDLGGLAVALGIGVGWLGIQALVGVWFEGAPLAQEVELNWRVLAFTVVVGSLGTLLVGALPMLQIARASLRDTLVSGAR